MTIGLFVTVFLTYVILDIAWTKYTVSIAKNRKLPAALWAGVIPVLSAFLVLQYVENNWVLIPMALGGAAGTWFAMTYMKENDEES